MNPVEDSPPAAPGFIRGRPSVVKQGKTLAPGSIATFHVGQMSRDIFNGVERLVTYFDAGVFRPGPGDPVYPIISFVTCVVRKGLEEAPNWSAAYLEPTDNFLRTAQSCGDILTSEQHSRLGESKVVNGPQLFDLIAAKMAVDHIMRMGWRGQVEGRSDGRQVIDYLGGSESGLSLEAFGIDLAPPIRQEISRTGSSFTTLVWRWIPSKDNLAHPGLQEKMMEFRAKFRKGEALPRASDIVATASQNEAPSGGSREPAE